MPKDSKDDRKPAARQADETREALDFCFEDVSSLRMVGAAPLNDLMSAPSAGSGRGASPEPGREGSRRGNLLLLVLLVLTMAAVIAATLMR